MTDRPSAPRAVKVLKAGILDLLRNRVILVHGSFFLLAGWGLLLFSEDAPRTIVSLSELILLVIPLVGFVFGTIYFYNSREFIELLLAHPIDRGSVFLGHFLGLALSLACVFAVGVAIPFAWYRLLGKVELDSRLLALIGSGVLLTLVSTGISYLVGLVFENRIKGLIAAITLWFAFTFVYDGLILFLIVELSAFPLEKPVLALSMLNPVDLARISVLLNLNIAALMGYTGAVFQRFLGSGAGQAATLGAMLLWIAIPIGLGLAAFRRKDF